VRENPIRPSLQTRRYLGLELSGAKSEKTAVAAIEFYPRESKVFLLDTFDRQGGSEDHTADETLLHLLNELSHDVRGVGVNVPLSLPPCIECERKTCPLPAACTVPAVKWMREQTRNAPPSPNKKPTKALRRQRDVTPYTQRPVETYLRQHLLPKLPEEKRFDIDEALGGTKAPLTARIHFLKRHLNKLPLIEVSPKLTLALLAQELGIQKRAYRSYRHLEEGAHARGQILETLAQAHGVFFYERDLRKLSTSLTAFDAFFCAYTALLVKEGRGVAPPKNFPIDTGWIHFPKEKG
jgi:hypothetical protein